METWSFSNEPKKTTLNSKEIETISLLAEIRRESADLKHYSLMLSQEEDGSSEENKKILEEIKNESDGINTISQKEAEKQLLKCENKYLSDVEVFQESAPSHSAYLAGYIAKLKQIRELPFQSELEKSKQLIKQRNGDEIKLSDLLPQAQILGITKRQVKEEPLPSIESLIKLTENNKTLLRDISLVLNEKERETFLSLLPTLKQREFGVIMDHELSKVLSDKIIESDDDKEQSNLVHTRLIEFLKSSDDDSVHVIKTLSDSLKNLESTESLAILKEASKLTISQEDNNFSRTARIIRTLAEVDMASGKGMIMEFLGNKNLPEKYFDYFLNYLHKNGTLTKSLDLTKDWRNDKYEKLFEYLEKNDAGWSDRANVTENFKDGVAIFGYRNMFSYAGRQDVTPHDALFQFKKIKEAYQSSTLTPAQFFSQVLTQVKLDSSTYESGLSYNEFNTIVDTIDYSNSHLKEMGEKVKQYESIVKLQELNEYLSDPKKIFSSWFNLRKFSDLSYLLNQATILKQLESLKSESLQNPKKAKLYDFIEQIAFNKTGKVDMKAVLEFWQKPETFLTRSDAHTPEALHDAVKPSNYTDVNYIDLSSTELRDALVDGSLDKIQTFKPMEIIYSVDKETKLNIELDFYSEVKNQIGSRREGTQNPKLFNEVKNILKKYSVDLQTYLINKREVLEELPQATQQIIQSEVREVIKQFPNEKLIQKDATKLAGKYRARMNYKSDPQAVLAGNDTACCMPFGSGKNNCYMWNPTTALFTLEEERGSNWRTIAQSVITLDVDTSKDISVLRENIGSDQSRLMEELPESILNQDKRYVSCDNIEVAQNFIAKKDLIEAVYRDFFSKYTSYSKENSDININTEKVIIGKANSDLSFGTQEKNTYLPVSLIGYSDKLGSQVDVIHFNNSKKDTFSLTEKSVSKNEEKTVKTERQSIQPLSSSDALSVAYLENKIYPKNMTEGFTAIQNRIFTSEIYNQIHKKEDLSLKYVDSENTVKGYVVAHEGNRNNERIVYFEDLAVDPKSRLAGGRLINAFAQKYIESYVSKGEMIPIFMQAREETSYQIVQKQLEKISETLGVRFRVEEGEEYTYGNSTMHEMTLRPYKR